MNKSDLKTSGIILRITDYKENDSIFDLFTMEGEVVGFFGRSAKKPTSKLHGVISIGNFINITYSKGKNLNYPKEISHDLKHQYKFPTKSLSAMYFYSDILVLTRLVSKDFSSPELFNKLIEVFESAEKNHEQNDLIKQYNDFLNFILDMLGIESEARCFISGEKIRDKEFYYHPDTNKIFSEAQKPKTLDIPLVRYDDIFQKTFLQKKLYEALNTRIRLKF